MVGGPRRQYEGGFGIVELSRDQLHLCGVEALRVQNDRERVPAEDSIGEDIHGYIASLHENSLKYRKNVRA